MAKYSKYFASSPDWERYSSDPSRPELALKTEAPSNPNPIDIAADRAAQAVDEDKWAAEVRTFKDISYHPTDQDASTHLRATGTPRKRRKSR